MTAPRRGDLKIRVFFGIRRNLFIPARLNVNFLSRMWESQSGFRIVGFFNFFVFFVFSYVRSFVRFACLRMLLWCFSRSLKVTVVSTLLCIALRFRRKFRMACNTHFVVMFQFNSRLRSFLFSTLSNSVMGKKCCNWAADNYSPSEFNQEYDNAPATKGGNQSGACVWTGWIFSQILMARPRRPHRISACTPDPEDLASFTLAWLAPEISRVKPEALQLPPTVIIKISFRPLPHPRPPALSCGVVCKCGVGKRGGCDFPCILASSP